MKQNQNQETRVEIQLIRPNSPYFQMLKNFCHLSKNLYNHANFLVRKTLKETKKWLRYQDLDKILRNDEEFPDYKNMPTAQSAQQILRLIDQNWSSFFSAIKDWKKNSSKYLGRPKPPKYLNKDGYFSLILTKQDARLKEDNLIHFPKTFNGFTVKPKFLEREDFSSFQQIRFKFDGTNIFMELVYKIEIPKELPFNDKIASIDIGVDNLATLSFNFNKNPVIFNGKPLKSMNQFYNKELSKMKSCLEKRNHQKSSNRIDKLSKKRTRKINDYLHKTSRKIINILQENNISVLIIGKNKNWKQKSSLSSQVNQSFVQIPFARFIELLEYKARELGIKVILVNESYTSGTSFLDDELPTKKFYDKKRRVKRGLFVSNGGTRINSDVNGSLQIMRKVFPNAFSSKEEKLWDRGFVLNPVVVACA